MKKSKNPETGVVHWVTDNKPDGICLVNLCGMSTRLLWTKADDEKVTCRKCLSEKRE